MTSTQMTFTSVNEFREFTRKKEVYIPLQENTVDMVQVNKNHLYEVLREAEPDLIHVTVVRDSVYFLNYE